jgi:hypothetical protein
VPENFLEQTTFRIQFVPFFLGKRLLFSSGILYGLLGVLGTKVSM